MPQVTQLVNGARVKTQVSHISKLMFLIAVLYGLPNMALRRWFYFKRNSSVKACN